MPTWYLAKARVTVTQKETPAIRKVMLPSDQEPSIIDVKHKAGMRITTEIVHEESSVGDSNSNGSIKRAEQPIPGQIRAIKDFTERQIGATMGHDNLEVACATCGLDTGYISCRRRRGNSAPAHQWHTIHRADRRVRRADILRTVRHLETKAETQCEMVGRLLARSQHAYRSTHRERQRSSDDAPQHPEAKQ